MNKKANKRAFFVCIFICLMYVSVVVPLPGKMDFRRISNDQNIESTDMGIYVQNKNEHILKEMASVSAARAMQPEQREQPEQRKIPSVNEETDYAVNKNDSIEPSLFISLPLVCLAIKEKKIDKNSLIMSGMDKQNVPQWKKPVDILSDKDEEGLKNISKKIGDKDLYAFLKTAGISLKEELSAEAIMLGKGFVVEKKKLLLLYNNIVSDDYKDLFPFIIDRIMIDGRAGNFEFVYTKRKDRKKDKIVQNEWVMPNVTKLPIRIALDKLTVHTAKIKVYGSGIVVEQFPRPFEKIIGETECIIYGKIEKQLNDER